MDHLNYCIQCGAPVPKPFNSKTACTSCHVLLAEWWDFEKNAMKHPMLMNPAKSKPNGNSDSNDSNGGSSVTSESHTGGGGGGGGSPYSGAGLGERFESVSLNGEKVMSSNNGNGGERRVNRDSIEERFFQSSLILLEGHFQRPQTYMREAMGEVKKMVAQTLDQSLNKADVRETLAKNVSIWMRLQRVFYYAIPLCERRSLSSTHHDTGPPTGQDVAESATLILKHHDALRDDLHYLNSLLVISRNMLAIKETAQEICGAVGFDREVKRLIELCVQVTSKGYDGENVAEGERGKLLDVTELYKKVLVTCLQHTHNWTMGNDRFKMSFWFEMLFDDEWKIDPVHFLQADEMSIKNIHDEVKNWLIRHSRKDPLAAELLAKYEEEVQYGNTPGPLPILNGVNGDSTHIYMEENTSPVWKHDEPNKMEQDRLYARVSHEIDIWWKRVRDENYEGWVVPMETVDGAKDRAKACRENAMERYMPRDREYMQSDRYDGQQEPDDETLEQDEIDNRSTLGETGEDIEGEEDDEDDEEDEYVEGPLRGLLTEIPNILDTKQIEALHMTVKACVVDSMGSGLTPAGENLQKTRCKMFLALDCGKNLLREMLVFIAVWEQTDAQFIFQITAQIIESFHHNALLPYAWNSLRILKDIVSPAQTVLLRLINYMFRARKDSPIYDDLRDYNRDAKLIHFLYNYFRCRVVPDCIALISAQSQIRQGKKHPNDFPVDLWDMERAKDGLSQYLDFISVVAEITEMRPLLVEWEAVYELTTLLKALEQGVPRKSIDERPMPGPSRHDPNAPPPQANPNLPPLHDTPHKFPWGGIKIQILIILTSLLAPTNPRRTGPGNPTVQQQLIAHEGIMPLLNCCVYDGHNEFLKERATLAIKFAMEGCIEAQNYVKELVPVRHAQAKAQLQAQEKAQERAIAVHEQTKIIQASLAARDSVLDLSETDDDQEDDDVPISQDTTRRGQVTFVGPGAGEGSSTDLQARKHSEALARVKAKYQADEERKAIESPKAKYPNFHDYADAMAWEKEELAKPRTEEEKLAARTSFIKAGRMVPKELLPGKQGGFRP